MTPSRLHVTATDEEFLVAVAGPLDTTAADEVALTIRLAVTETRPTRLVLDLTDAEEVGPTATTSVRHACATAQACGVPVRVVCVPPAGDAHGRLGERIEAFEQMREFAPRN